MGQDIISLELIKNKLELERQRDPKSVVLLYPDKDARYETIAKVLGSIYQAGIGKIGFITQPNDQE